MTYKKRSKMYVITRNYSHLKTVTVKTFDYNVTFKDAYGNTLKTETVDYGSSATSSATYPGPIRPRTRSRPLRRRLRQGVRRRRRRQLHLRQPLGRLHLRRAVHRRLGQRLQLHVRRMTDRFTNQKTHASRREFFCSPIYLNF